MTDTKLPHRVLPIWPTVRETFKAAFRNSSYLARVGWPWCLLAVGLLLMLSWLFGRIAELAVETTAWNTLLFDTLQSAIRGFCLAAIAVPWHRHFLAADAAQPVGWWRTVALYGLIATAIEFAVVVGYAPISFASSSETTHWLRSGLTFVGVVAALYATARLAFMLPAVALGRDGTATAAWRATRGNGWRLVLINLIVILIALIPFMTISSMLFESGYVSTAMTEFTMLLVYLFGIITLSITYRELVLKPPSRDDKIGP